MRLKFRLILLLALMALVTFVSTGQVPIPLQETWENVEPTNEEFFVTTPVNLKRDGETDAKSSRKYYGEINGTYLYIFSDPIKKPNNFSVVSDFVSASGKTLNSSTGSSQPEVLKFVDSFGYSQTIVLTRSANRIYIAQTVSKDKDDRVAKQFISSFRLGSSLPVVVENSNIDAAETATDPDSKTTKPSSGSGSGRGNGTGSGTGTGGIGTGPVSPPIVKQTTSVKILSKPRPAYTNLARFYGIMGTVILRVTFLSSGEIGAISAVKSLPFGLANQALDAAKRTTFEPAYQEGKAITVTKQIEYSFLIY
ncbi:MAG: energy transducer TonB [Chloracidobacterium sp.]|nr:energy transducer TonB [Chloracidobacterium sp.]